MQAGGRQAWPLPSAAPTCSNCQVDPTYLRCTSPAPRALTRLRCVSQVPSCASHPDRLQLRRLVDRLCHQRHPERGGRVLGARPRRRAHDAGAVGCGGGRETLALSRVAAGCWCNGSRGLNSTQAVGAQPPAVPPALLLTFDPHNCMQAY